VNNKREEEIPLLNIERNPLVLLVSGALTVLFMYLTYKAILSKEAFEVNPLGFFLFVPTLLVSFQTLWYLLNPYAVIFKDKLEIRKSLFQNKFWHFVDIKKVSELKEGTFMIVYNDDEIEKMNLFGIRSSQRGLLREELNRQILSSLDKRP
jgi:hypothetical protein